MKGRLTADVTIRTANSGTSIAGFTLAVDRKFKNKDGEKQTDFIRMTAFGKTAEFLQRYTSKGQEILIEGEMQQNDWEKDGVKHQSYQVVVNQVHFCGSKNENGGQQNGNYQPYGQQTAPTPAAPAQQSVNIGDIGEFEEILSDGEIPF
jgi:single-strand DNA-binding protein